MRRSQGAAALALTAALLSPSRADADERPHVRVELIAAPDLPACDRERDFRSLVGAYVHAPLLDPPTTGVLRARFGQVPGGYSIDLTLSSPGASAPVRRHLEYVGVCCWEAMYLAAKVSARLIAGDAAAPPPLTCPACEECTAAAPMSPSPSPSSERKKPMASALPAPPTRRSGKARDFPQVELEVGPDLPACMRLRDLRRILEELALPGFPIDTVITVRIRRTPRGGFAVDVRLDDEEGNPLGAEHLDLPDMCCFQVLYLAAVEGASLLYANSTEPTEAELDACPPCKPCPPEVPPPPPPAPVTPARRPPARHVDLPPPRLTRHLMPGVLVGPGIASGWGPGVQLGGDVRIARWSFELDASVMFPVSFEADGAKTPSAWSTAWTVSGSLAGCRWFDDQLAGCLVGTAGMLHPTRPWTYANFDLWGFAAAGLRVVWEPPMLRWSTFGVRLQGELAWAFWRPENRDAHGETLTPANPFVGHLGATLVWPF